MSALSGYFLFKRDDSVEPFSVEDFHKSVDVQNHRGPHGRGKFGVSFRTEDIAPLDGGRTGLDGLFGFNSFIVEGSMDDQLIVSPDKKVLMAYDGEIYNFQELKESLAADSVAVPDRKGDILLELYHRYGFAGMLKKLNGIFGFAVVDLRKKTICLANDRYGATPLYFSVDAQNRLYFASEMKAIIQFRNFERKIDINAYNARLVFARPGRKVLLDNVELVPAGTVLTFSEEGMQSERYHSLDDYKRDYAKYESIDAAIEDLDYLLEKAIAKQLPGGKKLGIQLSGGIDSTILAHYAKKLAGDDFSEAFGIVDGRGDEGEEKYIKIVSDRLGLNLHKAILTPDYFMENYEKMIWHNDAPAYRPYFACFKKLGEIAKEYASVLYCGEGADEIAGGYSRFAGGYLVPFLSELNVKSSKHRSYHSYGEYAAMAGETLTGLLTNGVENANDLIQERIDLYNGFEGSALTKHLKFEIAECLPEASFRQGKMTMANSIENRVPLLDNDVVDFLMSLPEDMLVRFVSDSPADLSPNPFEWMQGKFILKKIVEKYFGKEFAFRKKAIMNIDDVGVVTSKDFTDYFYGVIYPSMRDRGIVDAGRIKQWYEKVREIKKSEFTMMWRAMALETWCQLFIDKRDFC